LEVIVQDLGALHRIGEVECTDIPSSEDDFAGIDHWEDIFERDKDFLGFCASYFDDRGLGEGAIEVW